MCFFFVFCVCVKNIKMQKERNFLFIQVEVYWLMRVIILWFKIWAVFSYIFIQPTQMTKLKKTKNISTRIPKINIKIQIFPSYFSNKNMCDYPPTNVFFSFLSSHKTCVSPYRQNYIRYVKGNFPQIPNWCMSLIENKILPDDVLQNSARNCVFFAKNALNLRIPVAKW